MIPLKDVIIEETIEGVGSARFENYLAHALSSGIMMISMSGNGGIFVGKLNIGIVCSQQGNLDSGD